MLIGWTVWTWVGCSGGSATIEVVDTDVPTVPPPATTGDTGTSTPDTDEPPVPLDFWTASLQVPHRPRIDGTSGALKGVGLVFSLSAGWQMQTFDLAEPMSGPLLAAPTDVVVDTGAFADPWTWTGPNSLVVAPDGTLFLGGSGVVRYGADRHPIVISTDSATVIPRQAGGVFGYAAALDVPVQAWNASGAAAEVLGAYGGVRAVADTTAGVMVASARGSEPIDLYLEQFTSAGMAWRNRVSEFAGGDSAVAAVAPVQGGTLTCGAVDWVEGGRWLHIVDAEGTSVWEIGSDDEVPGACRLAAAAGDGGWVIAAEEQGQHVTYVARYGADRAVLWERRIEPRVAGGSAIPPVGLVVLNDVVYVALTDHDAEEGRVAGLDLATGAYLPL